MVLATEPADIWAQAYVTKLESPPGFGRFMGWYRWIYGCAVSHPVTNEGFQHVGLVTQTPGKMETVHPTLFSLLFSAVFLFSFPGEPKCWYLGSKGVAFALGSFSDQTEVSYPVLTLLGHTFFGSGQEILQQISHPPPKEFFRSLLPQGWAWKGGVACSHPFAQTTRSHLIFVSSSEMSEPICLTRVCMFPVVVMTNDTNWWLNQRKFVSSQFWRPEVQDSGVGRAG